MNPDQGIFDLEEKMEKGLNTPDYFRNIVKYLEDFTSDDQLKMLNLRDLTGLSSSATRNCLIIGVKFLLWMIFL